MDKQLFSYCRAAGVLICAAALSLSSCSDKEKTPPTAKEVAIEKLEEQGVALTLASMCEAIRVGNQEQVRLLIEAGIDVNKTNYRGDTPLCWAAKGGLSEHVKLLLAAPGIDVNKAARYGDTPLYCAAERGHSECVKLLLAAPGINVNNAAMYGETPLYRAAEKGHSECVKLLLAAPGIDVNKANNWGNTPLSTAAYYLRSECVKLLEAAGAKK